MPLSVAMQRVGRVSRLEATQRLPPQSPFGTLARMRRSRRDRDTGIKVRAKREMQDGDLKTVAIDEI